MELYEKLVDLALNNLAGLLALVLLTYMYLQEQRDKREYEAEKREDETITGILTAFTALASFFVTLTEKLAGAEKTMKEVTMKRDEQMDLLEKRVLNMPQAIDSLLMKRFEEIGLKLNDILRSSKTTQDKISELAEEWTKLEVSLKSSESKTEDKEKEDAERPADQSDNA